MHNARHIFGLRVFALETAERALKRWKHHGYEPGEDSWRAIQNGFCHLREQPYHGSLRVFGHLFATHAPWIDHAARTAAFAAADAAEISDTSYALRTIRSAAYFAREATFLVCAAIGGHEYGVAVRHKELSCQVNRLRQIAPEYMLDIIPRWQKQGGVINKSTKGNPDA